jgi:dTDP-4-dehydrorhamnose 3,5-epimerase-like enzyme
MPTVPHTQLSKIIEVPKILDEGSLCFMEGNNHIPFDIKRVYYIYDVIRNAVRGRHAHRELQQVIFCLKGSITIILDNGKTKEAITLNKPNHGLFLDTYMWHEMVAFKEGTILLVVASDRYSEPDYIRDYETFLKEVRHDSHE